MNKGVKTRLIDRAIQEFFTKGITYLYNGRSDKREKHQVILDLFINRIQSEHKGQGYIYTYACYDGVWCFRVEIHNL